MRARIAAGAGLVALLMTQACGPSNPGPSGELLAMFRFTAYPGGTLVSEYVSGGGGPVPVPGTNGWREYRTDDPPAKIRSYYEGLAKANGWGSSSQYPADVYPGPGAAIIELSHIRRNVRILVSNGPMGQNYYGPKPVEPYPASPSPGASPTPTPSLPPGPWYVRTEGTASN